MLYRVELAKRVQRDLRKLPVGLQERLVSRIEMLGDNPRPRGVRKLAGEKNAYRIRVGDYRILYEIRDDVLVVIIVRIGHRSDVYR